MTPPVFDVPLLPKTARRGDAQDHLEFRPLGGLCGEPPDDRATRVALVGGVRNLHVLFEVISDPPLQVLARRPQESVFDDECVELYWADAAEPSRYLEVVVNPEGTRYAARVANPHASRETWHVLRGVPVPGMKVRVEGDPASLPPDGVGTMALLDLDTVGRAHAAARAPSPGRRATWEPDENRARDERPYESLVATGRAHPPDFHVPSTFATFRFVEIL